MGNPSQNIACVCLFHSCITNSSSVLRWLNCITAPSPPQLPTHDLPMADVFLLLPPRCVFWCTQSLNSSPFQLYSVLCNCPIFSLSTPMTPDIFVSSVQLNYQASTSCVAGSDEITTTGPKTGIYTAQVLSSPQARSSDHSTDPVWPKPPIVPTPQLQRRCFLCPVRGLIKSRL